MRILRNRSLRFKILMPSVIGVISFALYLIVNYLASNINDKMLVQVQEKYLPVLERASQNLNYLDKIKQDLIFAATSGEKSMIDESEKIADSVRANVKELDQLDLGSKDKVQAIDKAFSGYLDTAIPLTKSMISGADMSLAQPTMKKMKDGLEELEVLLEQYEQNSRDQFVGAIKKVNERSRNTLIIGLLLGTATMVLLLGIAWWGAGIISSDVKNVADSLKSIASGEADLTKTLQSSSKDEIGELVHWFNAFVHKLRELIGEIVNSTSHLAAATDEMAVIIAQTKVGAGRQLRETEQLATAIHEMSMTIDGMAGNASKAAEAAQVADKESASGKVVVSGTITTIDALVNEVERTAVAMNKLDQESNNIGKVLDVIRDIADQTNLLALNAAIEAARAGEQGRGFAVVADEVRVLAQRSSQSTNEIREIIERLQLGSRDAVQVMQSGRSKARESVTQAAAAGTALEVITTNVSRIAVMNTEIAVTAEEQSSVAEEVNKNIINISTIAQETSEGAEQTTQASGELAKLAVRLQTLVGQFKV
jgi:methyl-accepting chemotaxis protein